MQRYFIKKELINEETNTATIIGKDYHHIKTVMRMKKDDKIIICTDNNIFYQAVIEDIQENVSLKILSKHINNNELDCDVYIAQGLVRREKSEEVLRRLVELGGNGYLNVIMERSVVKAKEKKDNFLERRETIVKEASEQSERGKLLKCLDTKTFKEFLEFSKDFDIKLLCYETSGRNSDFKLKEVLNNISNKRIIALIGPEGGISDKELKKCIDYGFITIGLGKRILRTETAPLYLMSIIAYVSEMEKK